VSTSFTKPVLLVIAFVGARSPLSRWRGLSAERSDQCA